MPSIRSKSNKYVTAKQAYISWCRARFEQKTFPLLLATYGLSADSAGGTAFLRAYDDSGLKDNWRKQHIDARAQESIRTWAGQLSYHDRMKLRYVPAWLRTLFDHSRAADPHLGTTLRVLALSAKAVLIPHSTPLSGGSLHSRELL